MSDFTDSFLLCKFVIEQFGAIGTKKGGHKRQTEDTKFCDL